MPVTSRGIFYQRAGTGHPVLFLHGATMEGGMWAYPTHALGDHYCCLVPDRRGHGRSDPAMDGADPVLDLLSLLDDEGIEHCHVVGHSLGGYDAVGLAGRFPQRVSSLVLVGAWMPIPAMTWSPPISIAREQGTAAARRAWMADPIFDTARRDPLVWSAVAAMVEANDLSLWVRHTAPAEPKPPNPVNLAPGITSPTLIVVGEHETEPFAEVARWLHTTVPGAAGRPIAEVPCTGHMSPMEHPTKFATLLSEFIAHR